MDTAGVRADEPGGFHMNSRSVHCTYGTRVASFPDPKAVEQRDAGAPRFDSYGVVFVNAAFP